MESPKIFLLIRNPFAKGAEDLQLSIDSQSSIFDVKNQVSQNHPENPAVSKQKLICAGKILADSQKLTEIFKDVSNILNLKVLQKGITAPQVIHLVINRGPTVDLGASSEEKKSSPSRSSAPTTNVAPSTVTFRPLSASQSVNPRVIPIIC
jgi:hypothetical protein